MKATTSYKQHRQQVIDADRKRRQVLDNLQPEFTPPTWRDYFGGLAFLVCVLAIGFAALVVAGGSAPVQGHIEQGEAQ